MSVSTISGNFDADLWKLIRAYEEGGHSVFRPSGASRWMTCAGSVLAEIAAQSDKAGYDAAYGTVAHAIAEDWLRAGKRPKWAKPGATRTERNFVITIDEEMLGFVSEYVEWVRELGPGDVSAVETRVDFSDLTPLSGQGGTADHIHIANRTLTITDLKFGTGVRVYAKGNKQLRLYAYGAWRMWADLYDIDRIVMRIAQPRLEVFETWEITPEELLAFAEEAREAAHRAWNPNAKRTPSQDGCRFCTVSATCPALAAAAQSLADDMLADFDSVDPETVSVPDAVIAPRHDPRKLSTDELEVVLRWRGTFDAWFREVHDELLRRALDGSNLAKWKVVEGQTKRAWLDDETAAASLLALGLNMDVIFDRSLVSPKRASDLLRLKHDSKTVKKLLAPHVHKPPGKHALAIIEDGRPAIGDAADAMLDDLA